MLNNLKTTLNPAFYHGHHQKPPFFEGWYYKMVSADEKSRFAIIPGVILGTDAHAFIQVLDGSSGYTEYHSFPIESFQASKDEFLISIGANKFSSRSISLDINQPYGTLMGTIEFEELNPWPVTLISPGIMGWYAWVPGMECYHGVLSFNHRLNGYLQFNQTNTDFDGGKGYIEKDWGKSFPSAWVWFQTNHFESKESCLTASIALIPWMKSSFRGFIIGLWHDNHLYRFATYTGAKVKTLEILEHQVIWVVEDRNYLLEMEVIQAPGGTLLGPTVVDMGKRVTETLDARVNVGLHKKSGGIIFSGTGLYAGMEVNGDISQLIKSS